MKMRDFQASFAVCVVVLFSVQCTILENPVDNCKCANNGVCDGEGDDEFCRCKPGTSGDLCERVDVCDRRQLICGSHDDVKCVYDESTGGGKCMCENSTKFFDSETSKCRVPCNDNCHNGAKCEYVEDIRFCSCLPLTRGDFCETVDQCTIKGFCGRKKDVKCVYKVYEGAICKCDDPNKLFDYRFKDCRTPCSTNDDCRSFERCTQSFTGDWFCHCLPGKSGENCENINDCMIGRYTSCKRDNGRCFYNEEKERAECDCGVGKIWDDRSDQKRCRTPCKDNCAYSGVCEGDGDAKFCTCTPIAEGDLCEKLKDCSKEKNLCGFGNDVKCVFDERIYISKCVCDNSSKLFDYDEKRCRVPCKDDCHNNGKCEYVEADRDCKKECEYFPRFCFCQQGTSGDLCETVDDCTKNDFCGTKTDVKCAYGEKKDKATCKCDDPKKSFDPNTKMCKLTCKDDCPNQGECLVAGEYKFCKCRPGTSGDLCTMSNDCAKTDFCGAKTDVKCVYDENAEKSFCKCDDPTKHFDPITQECIRGMCTNNTCQTGGITAGSDGGEANCYCGVPFSGERCEEGGVCFCLRHCL